MFTAPLDSFPFPDCSPLLKLAQLDAQNTATLFQKRLTITYQKWSQNRTKYPSFSTVSCISQSPPPPGFLVLPRSPAPTVPVDWCCVPCIRLPASCYHTHFPVHVPGPSTSEGMAYITKGRCNTRLCGYVCVFFFQSKVKCVSDFLRGLVLCGVALEVRSFCSCCLIPSVTVSGRSIFSTSVILNALSQNW